MNAGGQRETASGRNAFRAAGAGLAIACGLLAVIMLVAFVAIAFWGSSQHGTNGIIAAAVAVGICWICATAALTITGLLAETPLKLHGMLVSILLRTMLPAVFGVVLQSQVPWLAQANVMGMLVAAFMVALVAETSLAVWLTSSTRSVVKAL